MLGERWVLIFWGVAPGYLNLCVSTFAANVFDPNVNIHFLAYVGEAPSCLAGVFKLVSEVRALVLRTSPIGVGGGGEFVGVFVVNQLVIIATPLKECLFVFERVFGGSAFERMARDPRDPNSARLQVGFAAPHPQMYASPKVVIGSFAIEICGFSVAVDLRRL